MNRPKDLILALALALPLTTSAKAEVAQPHQPVVSAATPTSSGETGWIAETALFLTGVALFRVGHIRKRHNSLRNPKEPMF